MKKTNKKGFTIVELVIVIAVIAILVAVLVPNISRLVKKANESSDLSLVRNLNTALAVENTTYATAYEAFEAVKEAGYDLTKIEAKASDNKILFDSANQCFAYLDGSDLKYYPNSTKSDTKTPDHQLWAIVTEVDEAASSKYSVYWNGANNAAITVNGVGFDAGDKIVTSVSFKGNDTDKNVVIRTNSFETTLKVDTAGSVSHYGDAGKIEIDKVASSSFHEFGNARFANLKAGNFVAEKGSNVTLISTMSGTTVNVDAAATVEVVAGQATVKGETAKKVDVAITGETIAVVTTKENGTSAIGPNDTINWVDSEVILLKDINGTVTISGTTTVIGNMTALNATIQGSGSITLKNINTSGVKINTSFEGTLIFDGGLLNGNGSATEAFKADSKCNPNASYVFKNMTITTSTEKGIKIQSAKSVKIENCVFDGTTLRSNTGSDISQTRSLSAIDITLENDSQFEMTIEIVDCVFKNIKQGDLNSKDVPDSDTAGAIKIKSQKANAHITSVKIQGNTFENCYRDVVIGKADETDIVRHTLTRYQDATWTITGNKTDSTADKGVLTLNTNEKKAAKIGMIYGGCAVYDIANAYSDYATYAVVPNANVNDRINVSANAS